MANRVLISGSSGYVGSRLCQALSARGCEIAALSRKPAGPRDIAFTLGTPISSEVLRGFDLLIHCAWDMKLQDPKENDRVNVQGSMQLLRAASEAGIKKIIFISSISAFSGCRSEYGKAKLAVEAEARGLGAIIIRPGLVYGDAAGGMVGTLEKVVEKLPAIPVVGWSAEMYLCHEDDLAALIVDLAENAKSTTKVITAACPSPLQFHQILKVLAKKRGLTRTFLPVPAWGALLALKGFEALGLRLNFKSDSLISLLSPNPQPDFSGLNELGVSFRPFDAHTRSLSTPSGEGKHRCAA